MKYFRCSVRLLHTQRKLIMFPANTVRCNTVSFLVIWIKQCDTYTVYVRTKLLRYSLTVRLYLGNSPTHQFMGFVRCFWVPYITVTWVPRTGPTDCHIRLTLAIHVHFPFVGPTPILRLHYGPFLSLWGPFASPFIITIPRW